MFTLAGKPDRRLGLKPARLEAKEDDGNPNAVLVAGFALTDGPLCA